MLNVIMAQGETRGPAVRPRGRPSLEQAAAIDVDLLDAAFREFRRHGYGGASMRSIAREANVSRTTLAARYATKADLFQAIVLRHIEKVGAYGSLMGQATQDLRAGLLAATYAAIEGCVSGPTADFTRLLLAGTTQFPELAESLRHIETIVIDNMANFIARCAIVDGVPCRDPHNPAKALFLLLRGWSAGYAIQGNETWADKTWVEPIIDLFIAGRATW